MISASTKKEPFVLCEAQNSKVSIKKQNKEIERIRAQACIVERTFCCNLTFSCSGPFSLKCHKETRKDYVYSVFEA